MNQTVKQRAVLVEIAPRPIDPIRHMAEALPKPRTPRTRWEWAPRERHGVGHIVSREKRMFRIVWKVGPLMRMVEFFPWGL